MLDIIITWVVPVLNIILLTGQLIRFVYLVRKERYARTSMKISSGSWIERPNLTFDQTVRLYMVYENMVKENVRLGRI